MREIKLKTAEGQSESALVKYAECDIDGNVIQNTYLKKKY